jgi:hypothetical protein
MGRLLPVAEVSSVREAVVRQSVELDPKRLKIHEERVFVLKSRYRQERGSMDI